MEESMVWEVWRKLSVGSRHLPLGVEERSRLTVTTCLQNMEEHLASSDNLVDD